MTITTPVEYLPLSPGVAVSMDCVRLSWQLEDRGLIVDLDADNRLVVLPDEALRRMSGAPSLGTEASS